MRSRNLTELWGWGIFRKYSKSKSLNLNCEAKNIFNRQVSLDSTSVGLESPIISSRVCYAHDRKISAAGCGSWNPGLSSYPLGHEILVDRIILILEIRDELWDREILIQNFLNPSLCRRSVSNCWTLDCWAVVLSTRPRSSCWENNFGTSWWIMRSRNINTKFFKSKSLLAVGLELLNLELLGRRLIH